MTSQYRHRRTSNPATPAPNPIEPGEIAVNTANRQLHLGDAASATLGTPKALIAIRYFDTAAQYVTNDFVVNGNSLYRANKATGPGAFTAADWVMMVGQTDPQYVEIAGDVMTGSLSLPAAAPTAGVHATNKTYVDALVASKSSVIVSDVKPTPDPIDSTLWYNTLDGQLYIRYNDGNSTQWVIAAPQPDIGQFVNKTGDTMTGELAISKAGPTLVMNKPDATTATVMSVRTASSKRWEIVPSFGATEDFYVSRYNDAGTYAGNPLIISRATGIVDFEKKPTVAGAAWAAPLDALAYSGMQVNGNGEVSQENGSTSMYGGPGGTQVTKYAADGWVVNSVGAQSISWGAGAAMMAPPAGYAACVSLWTNIANTAPAANDYLFFQHRIEGYRVSRLAWGTANAQPLSVGFWINVATLGTYSLAVRNHDGTRSYVTTFTMSAAGWQWKTFTIPGDTAGTWISTNANALSISITGMAGTTYSTPTSDAWVAGNFLGKTGMTNNASNAAFSLNVTGLIVLPGIELPSSTRAPLIMRPYDQELVTCKRYFQRPDVGIGLAYNTLSIQFNVSHPGMRAIPTVGNPGNVQVTDTGSAFNQSSPSGIISSYATANSGLYSLSNYTGLLSLRTYLCVTNNSTPLTADARL